MTEKQVDAIGEFFAAADKLKEFGIIRSDRYLGDIAEFICASSFGMVMAASGREPGHDGLIQDKRIQVKFHGGTSNTVDCGNPDNYDELIVVLGPRSKLRPVGAASTFLIYRISSDLVKNKEPHNDKKRRYSKQQLPGDCLVQVQP